MYSDFTFSEYDNQPLPLVVTPKNNVEMFEQLDVIKSLIEEKLPVVGAILFRGFSIGHYNQLSNLADKLCGEVISYNFGSTPRTDVGNKVYTSTDYPNERSIVLHNEMAYTSEWPRQLWFTCAVAAEEGGQTTLADSRDIYLAIPEAIREKFEKYGVKYVRNYRPFVDVSWQQTFSTDDKTEVEKTCRKLGVEFKWNGDELCTWQVCPGVSYHPDTKDPVWFNQAHLFHLSNLETNLRSALTSIYQQHELPRNALYGNGEIMPDEDVEQIKTILEKHTIPLQWQENDILLIDNMLVAHGRNPYQGERKVFCAMTQPCDITKL